MDKICADFIITTPMFLGGADGWEDVELKPTSIKGALRFWFRAINYGKYESFEEVKDLEDEVFGSTKSQSSFYLKISAKNIKIEKNASELEKIFDNNIAYLGYGLYEEKVKKYRPCMCQRGTFTLEIIFKKSFQKKEAVENLIKSIKALGLFGGLGSRNRRGFGSLTLNSISLNGKLKWKAPEKIEDLEEEFHKFYHSLELHDSLPTYTAFSKNSRTLILGEYNDYKSGLNFVGCEMKSFRKALKEDGKIVQRWIESTEKPSQHPKKIVFGLPQNYLLGGGSMVGIEGEVKGSKGDVIGTRRSSPLFIKIISIGEGSNIKYFPILTLFPSKFLPEGTNIVFKDQSEVGRKFEDKKIKADVSFELINKFLNKLLEEKPNVREVRP